MGAVVLAFVLVLGGSQGPRPVASPAELILLVKTYTVDAACPVAEAVAIAGGRIVAVGSRRDMDPWIGRDTKTIAYPQAVAYPGFIEGHAHFLGLGESLQTLDLAGAADWDEVVRRVAEAARRVPKGHWITGRGWHQDKWSRRPQPSVAGYPVHTALSRAVPDHPVVLRHASGHATLVNAKAMELAGITKNTPDPAGGAIVRDDGGEPIGVLNETASRLIEAARDRSAAERETSRDQFEEQVRAAGNECLRHGITSVHDAGASFADVDRYRRLAETNRLPVRLYVMLNESNERLAERMDAYRFVGLGDGRLTVRAIKRFIDGALGTRGAWLLEPYADAPYSRGLNTTPLEVLQETARLAVDHGFQLCVHAIGDRANRQTLDFYEEAFRGSGGAGDRRWRIEHAQHLSPIDIPRFAQLGVVAAMQGVHATSDAPFVVDRLGKSRAAEGAYAWRRLIDAGAVIVNGSDAPVERVDPIAGFYASVTRKRANGEAFFPEQRMSRLEALRSFTTNAAYAAFEEDAKGTLAPGKLADLVVLDRDILSVPEREILKTQVLATVLGGRIVYEKAESPP